MVEMVMILKEGGEGEWIGFDNVGQGSRKKVLFSGPATKALHPPPF